jgi:hypothetical protein
MTKPATEIVSTAGFAIEVFLDTVKLELRCGDEYEAQVLFDDLAERLQAGQPLTLQMKHPSRGEA